MQDEGPCFHILEMNRSPAAFLEFVTDYGAVRIFNDAKLICSVEERGVVVQYLDNLRTLSLCFEDGRILSRLYPRHVIISDAHVSGFEQRLRQNLQKIRVRRRTTFTL